VLPTEIQTNAASLANRSGTDLQAPTRARAQYNLIQSDSAHARPFHT
jgi:hypothetical protein